MVGGEGEGGWGRGGGQKKSAIRECTGKNAPPPPPPMTLKENFWPPPSPPCFKNMYLCYCFAISTVIICVM